RIEDRQIAQGDDARPVIVAFGKDGGDLLHFALGLDDQLLHTVERAAGAYDVVDDDDSLALDQRAVFFIQEQRLRRAGGDRYRFGADGFAHVTLVGLAHDNVGQAHQGTHLVDKGDALG